MPTASDTPSVYFRLSLLGHQVTDALFGLGKKALTQAPVLRYALVGTLGMAVFQAASVERAGAPTEAITVATASVFSSGAETTFADQTAADLAARETYKAAVARQANTLGLDRSALAAATLLRARTEADVDVVALADALQAAAIRQNAATATGWMATAATLFEDIQQAEVELVHLARRYSL